MNVVNIEVNCGNTANNGTPCVSLNFSMDFKPQAPKIFRKGHFRNQKKFSNNIYTELTLIIWLELSDCINSQYYNFVKNYDIVLA